MSRAYDLITDRILELLEAGTVPWRQPWTSPTEAPRNLVSGQPYRGINALVLGSAGFSTPWWVTFRQAKIRGGHVKKGERGLPCVYWKRVDTDPERSNGSSRLRSFLRHYTVFNVEQCAGLAVPQIAPQKPVQSINDCDRVVTHMPDPPQILHGGASAHYVVSSDTVHLPQKSRFENAEEYYSTLFHELVHATGHESRLARPEVLERHVSTSDPYGREELVAEIGAAYLCGQTGIAHATLENAVSYIAGWHAALKNDKRLIVHAASQAQKAADYVLGNITDRVVTQ